MNSNRNYDSQFNRADAQHHGAINEREFRQFLGPVIKDERRLSGTLNPQDIQAFAVCLSSLFSSLLFSADVVCLVFVVEWSR